MADSQPLFRHNMPICSPLLTTPNVGWWFLGDMLEEVFQDLKTEEVRKFLFEESPLEDLRILMNAKPNALGRKRPHHVIFSFGGTVPAGHIEIWPTDTTELESHTLGMKVVRFGGIGNVLKHSKYTERISRRISSKDGHSDLSISFDDSFVLVESHLPLQGKFVRIFLCFDKTVFLTTFPPFTHRINTEVLSRGIRSFDILLSNPQPNVKTYGLQYSPYATGHFQVSQVFNNDSFEVAGGSVEIVPHLPDYSSQSLKNTAIRAKFSKLEARPQYALVADFNFSGVPEDDEEWKPRNDSYQYEPFHLHSTNWLDPRLNSSYPGVTVLRSTDQSCHDPACREPFLNSRIE